MQKKTLLAVLCAIAWVLATPLHARAESEFCPASIPESHSFDTASTHVVALRLQAYSARSLHGDIDIVSDGHWYTAPFPETVLAKDVAHIESPLAAFDRVSYLSPVLYIQVPAALDQPTLWVADAATTGETVFGWDKQGGVQCTPPAGLGLPPKPALIPEDEKRANPLPAWATPDASSVTIEAREVPAPHVTCAVPSAEPTAVKLVEPNFPESLANEGIGLIRVTVAVALDSDGIAQGLWLYSPSPFDAANLAVLRAAHNTTYAAGRALCQNVPSIYLMQSQYQIVNEYRLR